MTQGLESKFIWECELKTVEKENSKRKKSHKMCCQGTHVGRTHGNMTTVIPTCREEAKLCILQFPLITG